MQPFRCLNPKCSENPHRNEYDFYASGPKCPKCKADARQPRYSRVVIPLVVMHYDPPDDIVEGKGKNHPACNPDVRIGTPGYTHASGNPAAVNCLECKETHVWKENAKKWGVEEVAADRNVEVRYLNDPNRADVQEPQCTEDQ